MDNLAIELAAARLEKAERAMQAFENATNYDEAEDAWTDFLLATGAIYSKLGNGAKGNGKSLAWFGTKKKLRKDDPVLRYLHYARNSEEHGLQRLTARHPDANWESGPIPFGKRISLGPATIHDGETNEVKAGPFEAFAYGPRVALIRACDDRFHDFCDPPYGYEGIVADDPLELARVALPMFEAIIEEARKLV
jgi:hypothetical protein